MTMKLHLINPDMLPNIMGLIYPKIDAATKYSVGKYNGVDIVKKLIDAHMQLWIVIEDSIEEIQAIVITELSAFPQAKICRLICCTGEGSEKWVHLISEIEDWAKENGCDGLQAECRPGWEKILKHFGYEKSHVILNKAVQK
jgi:hypothetical protein